LASTSAGGYAMRGVLSRAPVDEADSTATAAISPTATKPRRRNTQAR